MPQTAAIAIDVRHRATDSAGAWSTPHRFGFAQAITVSGLDRGKSYDFQVRSVSSCGATSAWVPAAHVVSSALLLPGDIETLSAQSLADGVHLDWTVAVFQPANVEYSVERATAAAGPFAERTRVRTLGYTDPENTGTLYYYRVRAVTYSGIFGAYSDVVNSNGVDVSAIKNTADTANANVPTVLNPYFKDGSNGWTLGAGWTVDNGFQRAVHTGTGAVVTKGIANDALVPVKPGNQVKVSAVLTANGADGSCAAAVYWYDANATFLSYTLATGFSVVTGTAPNTASQLVAVAPANAAYAAAACVATNHANGTYTASLFMLSVPLSSLDELPDGTNRYGSVADPATQATQAAQIAASYQPGQNIVPNPSFAIGCDQNNPIGWNLPGGAGITSVCQRNNPITLMPTAAYIGLNAAGPVTAVATSSEFPCPSAGALSAQLKYYLFRSYSSGDAACDIEFFDSSNVFLSRSPRIVTVSVATPTTTFAKLEGIVIPANTAFARIRWFIESAQQTSGSVNFFVTDFKVEIGSTCTPFSDYASQYGNQLVVPGSTQQLGDQRNLPSSNSRGFGAVRSATALTAHSTGAVDVNAHTLRMGSALISYNAHTNAVTGLPVGSTQYIYTRDNYAGGSPTCLATTSAGTANSFDDAYIFGSVTIPSSGDSGGGPSGGGGQCVGVNMFLRRGLRAKDVRWWHWLDCARNGRRFRWFQTGIPRIHFEPCVRVVAEGGASLECSINTPFDLRDGSLCFSRDMYGHEVLTDRGWRKVVDVIGLGIQPVMRIHVGGRHYAAGTDSNNRIYSHNSVK